LVYANVNAGRGGGGDFVVEEGATVRYGQALARLPDNTNMQVKAKVAESFVTMLRPGMKAKIKLDAFNGDPLAGEVIRVNDFPEPGGWMASSTKEYAAIIRITNPPPRLRSGLTSEVEIVVEDLPNEIQIPVQSVYEHRNVPFCLVKNGKGFETRQLTLGSNNDKTVVVKDGVKVDEQVVLDPSSHLDLFKFPNIAVPEPEPTPPGETVIAEASPKTSQGKAESPFVASTGAAPADPNPAPPGSPGPPSGGRSGRNRGGMNINPEERFRAMDTNGDGNVTQEEVDANPNLDDRAKGFAMRGDEDGDGNLTLDEMKSSLEKMRAMMRQGGGPGGPGGPPGVGP
jgi:HlyD family secretion protein